LTENKKDKLKGFISLWSKQIKGPELMSGLRRQLVFFIEIPEDQEEIE